MFYMLTSVVSSDFAKNIVNLVTAWSEALVTLLSITVLALLITKRPFIVNFRSCSPTPIFYVLDRCFQIRHGCCKQNSDAVHVWLLPSDLSDVQNQHSQITEEGKEEQEACAAERQRWWGGRFPQTGGGVLQPWGGGLHWGELLKDAVKGLNRNTSFCRIQATELKI